MNLVGPEPITMHQNSYLKYWSGKQNHPPPTSSFLRGLQMQYPLHSLLEAGLKGYKLTTSYGLVDMNSKGMSTGSQESVPSDPA